MALPWCIGHLTLGLLVYLIPNTRHLELFIGLSGLPFLSLWYFLPESPRWLLSKGKTDDAIKVLSLACKWNKKPVSNLKDLRYSQEEANVKTGSIKDLFIYPAIRRNTICILGRQQL